jgi:GntR family transcriptional regulator
MFIRIDKGSSVPVSRQITQQLRAQCLSGLLRPGNRLPSVRELARDLAVNVNTVLRVYERLAAEQLIELRHGEGTFVRDRDPTKEMGDQLHEQRQHFANEFAAMVQRGLLLGLTPQELRQQLKAALDAARNSHSQDRPRSVP